MKNYPKSVSKECTENILNQMDNIIYKMENHNEKLGTGFFCKLNYNNNIFPVLITSYQIINEKYILNNNSIEVSLNENKISVEFGLTKYMNKKYNLSVIEIIQDKNEKINFIEIDKNIYEKDAEDLLNKNSIYIIHCKEEKNKLDKFVSYGVIDCMNDIKLKLLCNMNSNLNGYSFPIFNLSNNKLIGIYNNDDKFKNDGIFMKYIIKEFLEEYKYKKYYLEYNNRSFINEINILINAEKEDINKEIYFLNGESEEKQDSKYINENIKQLNDMNTELYINNKKENYKKFFKPEREGEYNINIKFNIYLTDCSYMFAGCEKIIKIKFVTLYTKYVKSMKYMFYKCKNLKNIYNLFSFNTTNVTYMDYMFYECQKLNSLDLSSFNTKNVTDMSYMFCECEKLKSLDLSSFVIQDETKMDNIFINCWKLNLNNLITSYDINKKIKTSKNLLSNNEDNLFSMNNENFENEISILIEVDKEDLNKKIYFLDNSENHNYYVDLITSDTKLYINKKREKSKIFFIPEKEGLYYINILFNYDLNDCHFMFKDCKNIIEIKFISFKSTNIRNMNNMFDGCINLKNIYNLHLINTQYVEDMSYMFNKCHNLCKLNLDSFEVYYLKNTKSMFGQCSNLINLEFPHCFNTKNVTNMSKMFNGCINLKQLDLLYFNTVNVTDMSFMFYECNSLFSIDLSSFNTINVKYMNSMFHDCKSLTDLNLSHFNTENVIDMKCMFNRCSNINTLNLSEFNTQNVTKMYGMFQKCSNLTKLELPPQLDTKNVEDLSFMFKLCIKLEELELYFNAEKVIKMDYMFQQCQGLKKLKLCFKNTQNVTNMSYMFDECNNLNDLDISSFDTQNVMDMKYMFNNCYNLTNLDLSNFITKNVTDMSGLFNNCKNLVNLNISGFKIKKDTKREQMIEGCRKLNLESSIINNIINI